MKCTAKSFFPARIKGTNRTKHKYCRPRKPAHKPSQQYTCFLANAIRFLKSILVLDKAHTLYLICSARTTQLSSGVPRFYDRDKRTFCYVLFALMQKVPKKSRPKNASARLAREIRFEPVL
jgi:hypothetical protein